MILGLDIGGANTKAASSDGRIAESVYLPLWKDASLGGVLSRYAGLGPESVGVVITGELADCYFSKLEGVKSISAQVEKSFQCPVHFWGFAGFDPQDPLELAAANWSATAAFLAGDVGDCLLVDMGSTTTDLIPIKGRPLAEKSDFLRLSRGELLYMGLLRTGLGALLQAARLAGERVPLSSELFSIAADAYLALEEISSKSYSCDTPDGAGKTQEAAMRRLARQVCADLEEIGEAGAMAIARQVRDRQFRRLVMGIERQARNHGLKTVAATGIGELMIAEAASFLGLECIRLSQRYGSKISDIFPAYAVARLLEMKTESFCEE
ncbi:MAG: hydantoinase [Methanotrichaceae archaeon]|nr:hydantoinase [Methanotrichaceae archaeon]